jgi:hypothetical protein
LSGFFLPVIKDQIVGLVTGNPYLQSVENIEPIEKALQKHGIAYTRSKSGRAAIFFRDPDQNVLEMAEMGSVHERRQW